MPYVNKPRPYKKEYQQQLSRGEADERLERQRARETIDKKSADRNKDGRADVREGKDVAHIRELANYTGDSFEDMKLQVKLRAGLCTNNNCKSFSDCSKEELAMAIQASIEIGDLVGFNLH